MELQKIQKTTLTMKEASEYLGISYWLINQLVRRKQIPCSKVGGKYLFRVQALDEYLSKMEKEGIHKKSIFSSDKRHYNHLLKDLKVGVTVLDDEYQIINFQNMLDGKSVIGYYCNLFFGIIFLIISLIWVAHILLSSLSLESNLLILFPFLINIHLKLVL